MNFYKGIDLDRNANLYNYIHTYHKADCELREVYMEADKTLQKYVRNYHLEIKLYKIAFNLGIYAMFYGIYTILKG